MKLNGILKIVLTVLSVFSMVYLISVISGAYSVILTILIRFIHLPKELFIATQHHLSLYLALALAYTFLSRPARKDGKVRWGDIVLAIIAFSGPFYRFLVYHELMLRMGITTTLDIIFGLLTIIAIVEGVRRASGLALTLVVLAFTLYTLWDVGLDFKIFTERLYLYDVGIFSTPLSVAVMWISVFLFFGYFLDELGLAEFFVRLALATVGNKRGGPAKASVIGGSLIGTTTGSAVGSSVLLSTFLVPAMKKFGYSAEEAAALMAATGTGAQIMPPILGSAAFIMPLYLGVTYWTVVVASIVPALIYFTLLFIYTDLIAVRRRLLGLPRSELPQLRLVLREIYLTLPLAVIVYLLAEGYDPQLAAICSLIVALLLGALKSGRITSLISFAIVGVSFLVPIAVFNLPYYAAMFLAAGLLVPACLIIGFIREGRGLAQRVFRAIVRAMKDSASIVVICAGAGLIAGGISLTGLAYTLGRSIYAITGGNLVLICLITMVIAIILGCAVPTPVVYVMTVSILGPLAFLLNIPPIALHYFIFYFGIFAPLTPPVALAAMASASVAGADYIKTTIIATVMTLSAWVLGWIMIFRPEIHLVTVSTWSIGAISMLILAVTMALLAGLSLMIAQTGVFYGGSGFISFTRVERVYYVVPAVLGLYAAYSGSTLIGLLTFVLFVVPLLLKTYFVQRVGSRA
jgi:TRAP transporter 4TM/12TM fusion protein